MSLAVDQLPQSLSGLARLETSAWRSFKKARIARLRAEISNIERPTDCTVRELTSAKAEEQRAHRRYTAVAKHKKAAQDAGSSS